MKPIKGLDNVLHLTIIAGGKPMLVDVKVINKALHSPHSLTSSVLKVGD